MITIKTAILLYPFHRDDIYKLVKAAKASGEAIDIYDITKNKPDLSGYDYIGIASGVYSFQPGKTLIKYLQENLPVGREIFVMYTYGVYRKGYTDAFHRLLKEKECRLLGEYGCLGCENFGPFRLAEGTFLECADEAKVRACVKLVFNSLAE